MQILFRFFRHDDAKDGDDVEWNIASTPLEQKIRIYRFLFRSSAKLLDYEQRMNLAAAASWCATSRVTGRQISEIIANILVDPGFTLNFKQGCIDLLAEDPWLAKTAGELGVLRSGSRDCPKDPPLPERDSDDAE